MCQCDATVEWFDPMRISSEQSILGKETILTVVLVETKALHRPPGGEFVYSSLKVCSRKHIV